MKLTTLAFASFATFATAANGASITIGNIFTGEGNDLAVLDGFGNGISADSGAFIAAHVFPDGAPTDFFALQANGDDGPISSIGLTSPSIPVRTRSLLHLFVIREPRPSHRPGYSRRCEPLHRDRQPH